MDERKKKELEWLQNMTFEEYLEVIHFETYLSIFTAFIIVDADKEERRQKFYRYVRDQKVKLFDPTFHQAGDESYQVVIVNEIKSPKHLVEILIAHNRKILTVDSEKVFSSKWYIAKMEGAICSSPDSGTRWRLQVNTWDTFNFKGKVIVVSNKSRKDLKKDNRLTYILRDSNML